MRKFSKHKVSIFLEVIKVYPSTGFLNFPCDISSFFLEMTPSCASGGAVNSDFT